MLGFLGFSVVAPVHQTLHASVQPVSAFSASALPVTPAYRVFLASVHPVLVVISFALSLDKCTGVLDFPSSV